MNNPKHVRDRTGQTVTRADGVLLDGDVLIIPKQFMDGAAPAVPGSPEFKAGAEKGIAAALRDHAARACVRDGAARHPGDPHTGHFTDAQVQALEGHRATMKALLTDRWKGPQAKPVLDSADGQEMTYEQRMVKRSGGYQGWAG